RARAKQGLRTELPQPRFNSAAPAGGKVGSTFELSFTGTDLEAPEALLFNHPGFKATPIMPDPPKEEPKKEEEAKKGGGKKGAQKAQPSATKFNVTIGPNVPLGFYDVRVVAKDGDSNARTFVVGDLPEVAEKEPNNDVDQAQRVEINTTINGTIAAPTDVDYFVFAGKRGQRVLIHCQCGTIDSKLTPEIKILDKDNREIAAHRAAPLADGLVDLTLDEDGDYKIRLVQFAHQIGGPELFYRLSITTAPWIDAVFPAIVEPGKTSEVTLYGRN